MSRNSRNRDIYYAKLKNATGGDPEGMMKGLMESPYRSHRERAQRILSNAGRIADQINHMKEANSEA